MLNWNKLGVGLIVGGAVAGAALGGGPHEYRVTFDALWNPIDHPNFPASAHFSPLIGASHGAGFDIWSPGETASQGVENVAETGSTLALTAVINSAVSDGEAATRVTGAGPFSPGVAQTNIIEISEAHPLLSLITMVAPTHDWFVGIDSLDLRDGNGQFVAEIVIDLVVWDAGTEPGSNFSTSGSAVEGGVIHLLPNAAAIFGGPAPIARMTITRLTPLTGDLNADGIVDTADLGLLIGAFGTNDPTADMNDDEIVDTADLGLLIGNFGASDLP